MEYLTFKQAQERAQIGRNTLLKWIKEGLPVIQFSSQLKRIRTSDFDAWMVSRGTVKTAGGLGSQEVSNSVTSFEGYIENKGFKNW